MTVVCTCPQWGRAISCPFHGDAAQIFNRPDKEQLDRIEDKLDWLHAQAFVDTAERWRNDPEAKTAWPGDRKKP